MRYAISDIHGCPKTFQLLLQTIDFSQDDELYLLGDYVDRGPDSLGVINHIRKLQDEGHTVHCLRGNHEQMLLDAWRQNNVPWDFDAPETDKRWLLPWLEQLAYYFEIDDYILVHAGLNFHHHYPLKDTHAMLWERGWYDRLDRQWLGRRIIVHGHTPEPVISVRRGIDEMALAQRVCIDSGCAMRVGGMGYLTALNLDTRVGVDVRKVD